MHENEKLTLFALELLTTLLCKIERYVIHKMSRLQNLLTYINKDSLQRKIECS